MSTTKSPIARRIEITRERTIQLAEKYRIGDEPLTATIGRVLERYDVLVDSPQQSQPVRPDGQLEEAG